MGDATGDDALATDQAFIRRKVVRHSMRWLAGTARPAHAFYHRRANHSVARGYRLEKA